VPDLVALLLPGGPGFLDALGRVWDAGDTVLPLDPRAPRPHTDRLLADLGAGAVIEADGERRRLDGGRPTEPGDAVVVATSGTTGAPKGAVISHAAVEYAAYASATALGIGTDVRWLACLPLSHVGGFSVLTRARVTGAGLEVHPRADAAAIDDAAARGGTHVSLVPTLLPRIRSERWRVVLLGGSAVPADRPANTVATYGMTETYGGVVYDGLALNGVAVRIVGSESRPADEPGPVEISSPTLLRCYRDGTVPLDRRGWFRTGDLGTLDPATGRLQVAGRADDLIITGGEKVWPAPVERALAADEDVAEVAVAGRPDPEWGQRVVAFVVPVDRSRPPTLGALRDRAKAELPAAAAPRELVLVDSLPRTALGKIAVHELADTGGELLNGAGRGGEGGREP
jgi:O-succinylbenzoic acid--CoA ligase